MGWKSKLDRFVAESPPKPASPAPQPLDELRAKMARLLGQEVAPQPAPARVDLLDFAEEDTPFGPLYVRRRRTEVSARIGRAELRPALDAASEMLALLALDPRLASCDPRCALYLDTETTGLVGGAGTVAFLVGLSFVEEGELVTEQFLLRRLGEEAPIVARLSERIEQASMLVSFNGKAFDLPLLRTRAVMSRMPALPERPHLDLVHVARRLHKRRLGSCSLTSLERAILGFFRQGDIPSSEIAPRYAHFLRTGDAEGLRPVVEHNDWDLASMVALVGLYGEPLESLQVADWVAVAQTLRRAGSLERAQEVAEAAILAGGGGEAHRVRGEIAKARGDKALALADFARALDELDDPSLRLELAKLYEHYAKEFDAALRLVDQGTGEDHEALQRRRTRLLEKRRRARGD